MKTMIAATLILIAAINAKATTMSNFVNATQAQAMIQDGLMTQLSLGTSNGHGPCAVSVGQNYDPATRTMYGVVTMKVPNLPMQEFRFELNDGPNRNIQIQQFASRDWLMTRTYNLNNEYPEVTGTVTRSKTLHVKNAYPGSIFVQISDTMNLFCEIKQK